MATKKTEQRLSVREQVLNRIASGESLRGICSSAGMPSISTVMKWVGEDQEFSEQYTRAREVQAEIVFEDLDEVSSQAVSAETAVEVAGLRLKADNIKWKLARMSPRKYGDKVQSDVNLSVTLLNPDQVKRMAALING